VSRDRLMALASAALLCVVTIGGGTAVARLLPARLAQFRIPRVAAGRVAPPAGPVLVPAAGGGGATPAGMTASLAPVLASGALGPHAGAEVTDLTSGRVLYARAAQIPFTPASTAKIAVAAAALALLGPGSRVATRVVAGPGAATITLAGGGDATLAVAQPPAGDYPQPATLRSLAAATAAALRARHQRAVRLRYDTALFTGPPLAAGWPPSYITTGNVTVITSLEVDQGRLTAAGAPQDPDVPGNFAPRSADPPAVAAAAFVRFLAGAGITVLGAPAPGRAPAGAPALASVSSPPLAQVVQWMLTESNNVIAENLARQIAIASGRPASFAGAAAAELAVLRGLGVTSGVRLADGSGLSPLDRFTPAAELQLLRAAAQRPQLRAAITGLPVAGFSGTLAPGGSFFGGIGGNGLGVVRAKTGNLVNVAGLAGIAYARNGQLLGFAVLADRLRPAGLAAAAAALDRLAAILAGCGCR